MSLRVCSQRPTSANAGSGVAGCDLAPCREMPEQTQLVLARTDEANLEHPNAMTDYSNRTESLRPMMETTAFWGTLEWPSLQVHKDVQPMLPIRFHSFVRHGLESDAVPRSGYLHLASGIMPPCSGVYTHTETETHTHTQTDTHSLVLKKQTDRLLQQPARLRCQTAKPPQHGRLADSQAKVPDREAERGKMGDRKLDDLPARTDRQGPV